MIKKCIASLIPLLLIYHNSSGQRALELGLNSTDVIQNVIGFVGNSTQSIEPYTVSLRLANDKGAYRFGVGGGFSSENNQQIGAGVLDSRTSSVVISFGHEWRRPVAKKLRLFYGLEGIFSSTQSRSKFNSFDPFQSFTSLTNTGEKRYTASPFFGLHYQFNNWIGVSTKSRMNISISETMIATEDGVNGIKKGPHYTVNYYVSHALPNSIYVYFNLDQLPRINK